MSITETRAGAAQSPLVYKNWQELIKPSQLDVKAGHDVKRFASIVAEPLERGFGLTLGNALRRVLLSSLQGSAVTAIQIDGVLHEFSSIAGVREDVTDIVLNVKQLAIRMHADGPKRLTLHAQGPGEVTAGQITEVADVEILNKDLVLMHLDEGTNIRMELTINRGKGYVPAERNRPDDAPIGFIPVDSLFSLGWHRRYSEVERVLREECEVEDVIPRVDRRTAKHEGFDPKPAAGQEIQGPFGSIPTNLLRTRRAKTAKSTASPTCPSAPDCQTP